MAQRGNRLTLEYYMNNGSILRDPNALMVDTEVLTGLLDGSSVPRRPSTPIYTHKATGQSPSPGDMVQIESEETKYPDQDSELMNRGLYNVWSETMEGLDAERSIHGRLGSLGKIIAVVFCSLMVILVLGFAMMTNDSQAGDDAPAARSGCAHAHPAGHLPRRFQLVMAVARTGLRSPYRRRSAAVDRGSPPRHGGLPHLANLGLYQLGRGEAPPAPPDDDYGLATRAMSFLKSWGLIAAVFASITDGVAGQPGNALVAGPVLFQHSHHTAEPDSPHQPVLPGGVLPHHRQRAADFTDPSRLHLSFTPGFPGFAITTAPTLEGQQRAQLDFQPVFDDRGQD